MRWMVRSSTPSACRFVASPRRKACQPFQGMPAALKRRQNLPVEDVIHRHRPAVAGGEDASGLRVAGARPVLDVADFVVRIPMRGDCDSINAAVAAGVLLFEMASQHLPG